VSAVLAASLIGAQASMAAARNPMQTPMRSTQVFAPGWTNANKELGRVDAVLRVGKRVFVGGNFTVVGGHRGGTTTRMHLMSVRAGTGTLGPFAPRLNGRVYALALSPNGRLLYVGGEFTAVGSHPRDGLAAFNLRTGRLSARVPNLGISGTVRGLAVSRTGRIYVAGSFGRVSGVRRQNLAKLVLKRGRYVLNRRWHPGTNQDVRKVVVSAATSRVIVGGDFTSVNGLRGQTHIAALGQGRGKVLPWANHPRSPILDIALCGRRLYAAEGGPGGTALAYGLAGRRKWFYMTDGNIQATACVSGRPAFGMHGDYVAPRKNQNLNEHGSSRRIQRHKLFLLTVRGKLMRWNPDCSSTAGVLGVWALDGYKGNLYVGGDFTGMHGRAQQRFAILRRR
jgi:Rax2 C-terminal beta propeller domain